MRLFLLVFFFLYGALHLHVFLRARAAFDFGARIGIVLALFLIVMVLAPIIIRWSESVGFDLFARYMAWMGYIWLGFVFLFFSASLLVDFYRLVVYLGSALLHKDLAFFALTAKMVFIIPFFIAICISVYGYNEALNIRTEHVVINTTKLPKGVDRIRIAQISDVHLGLLVRRERLGLILEKVKAAAPDILVSTGDLVDGQINSLEGLADMIKEINPRYGKFAVLGNHEYYAGLKQAIEFKKIAGFTLLRGEGVSIDGIINLIGVDDPAAKYFNGYDESMEKHLLASFPRERFTILLKHRPLINKDSLGLFDLQLSGHVHKGQIFPFSLLTKIYYPKDAGLLSANGGLLYVSRGSGTWGPPIRFLAPPEVTVIDIVRGDDRKGT
jgi:predicted MPP superfamily phosphohydrolase